MLVEHGASVDARNQHGETPLHLAAERNYSSFVSSLLNLGADVGAQDNNAMTPLHSASRGPMPVLEFCTAFQLLLEHGASVDARNKDGRTPLHLAVESGRLTYVSLLLEFGADVDAQDNDGMTSLHLASKDSPSDVADVGGRRTMAAQLLLVHGPIVHLWNRNGQTPLHAASQHHLFSIVDLLLNFGAEVDAQDDDNMTPLHFAVSTLRHTRSAIVADDYDVKVIQLLLVHGANVEAQNNDGETPVQIAQARGEEEFIQMLLEHMQYGQTI
jgi:ankyrin repeat protein